MTSDLCFIVNVFNVIIISLANFVCVLLCVIEQVYRLFSLNPEYNHNNNHNHNQYIQLIQSFITTWVAEHSEMASYS